MKTILVNLAFIWQGWINRFSARLKKLSSTKSIWGVIYLKLHKSATKTHPANLEKASSTAICKLFRFNSSKLKRRTSLRHNHMEGQVSKYKVHMLHVSYEKHIVDSLTRPTNAHTLSKLVKKTLHRRNRLRNVYQLRPYSIPCAVFNFDYHCSFHIFFKVICTIFAILINLHVLYWLVALYFYLTASTWHES